MNDSRRSGSSAGRPPGSGDRPAERSVVTAWSTRSTAKAALIVLATALAFGAAWACRTTLLALFAGVVCATALKPFIGRLARLGLPSVAVVFAAYALVAVVLTTIALVVMPVLIDQLLSLLEAVPDAYQTAREHLLDADSQLIQRVAEKLPEAWPAKSLEHSPFDLDAAIAALGYGRWLLQSLLVLGAVTVFAFSWSLYDERTIRAGLLLLPPAHREAAREVVGRVQVSISAYVRGQATLCLVIGLVDFLAFRLIGVPYALPLALVAGLMEGVPFFGPIFGPLPAVLMAFSVSPIKSLWVVGAAIAIQQVEGYVLAPRVMRRAMGVHGFVMLLAIAGFGALMGVVGAVLAVPLAAVAQVLLDQFLFRHESPNPPAPAGRDSASRISYQLRELLHDVQFRIREKEEEASANDREQLEETIEAIARDLDRSLAAALPGAPLPPSEEAAP